MPANQAHSPNRHSQLRFRPLLQRLQYRFLQALWLRRTRPAALDLLPNVSFGQCLAPTLGTALCLY